MQYNYSLGKFPCFFLYLFYKVIWLKKLLSEKETLGVRNYSYQKSITIILLTNYGITLDLYHVYQPCYAKMFSKKKMNSPST